MRLNTKSLFAILSIFHKIKYVLYFCMNKMKKNQPSSLMQIQMPEIDPIIIPFITTIAMDKKNQKNIFKDLNNNLLEIENKGKLLAIAKDSLIKKQKDLISSFDTIVFPDFPSPKYVWSKKKCQRLYVKYYNCLIDFYEENLKMVDALVPFIKNCIEQSTPIKIEMDRFNKATNVGQNDKVDQALSRYTRMNNYVLSIESKGLNETCRYGDIKRSQVWRKMKEIAEWYENQGQYEGSANKHRYFPPNEFEEMFMKFILVTKISDKFKICVQKMPKYGTYEDFKKANIEQSIQSVTPFSAIDSNDNLLKCSLKNIQANIDNFKSKDKKSDSSSVESAQNDDDANENNNSNDDDKNENPNNENENDNNDDIKVAFIKVHDVESLSSSSDNEHNSNDEEIPENKQIQMQNNNFNYQRKKSVVEELRLQSLMDQNIDTDNFRNFILALFRLLKTNNPCTQAMLQLFHCAVIRILFDFYYVENSAILYGRNLKNFYIEICEEILNENPLQINISKKFFAQGEEELPMREIISNDPILQEGSSDLYVIQFMTNPLDMAIQVNRAFRVIQKSVDVKNNDGDKPNKISSGMTSDDFINMLKPLYATDPYVCPSGVCRFIELFCELFQLFDSLSYGLTTFSIVLKDIDEMAKSKEKSLNNNQD